MKLDWANLIAGFILGVGASAIAALAFEWLSGPRIRITPDYGGRALLSTVEYFHVVVRNPSTRPPLPSRRPAWSCRATLNVSDAHGQAVTSEPILARWASQPAPTSSFVVGTQLIQAADLAKMIAGRTADVHCHSDERLTIALKEEGDANLYLFTNESYKYEKGKNPAWGLPVGDFRLTVSIYYESGMEQQTFKLINGGSKRSDVRIEPWGPGAA